jgi:hypothetical protein
MIGNCDGQLKNNSSMAYSLSTDRELCTKRREKLEVFRVASWIVHYHTNYCRVVRFSSRTYYSPRLIGIGASNIRLKLSFSFTAFVLIHSFICCGY